MFFWGLVLLCQPCSVTAACMIKTLKLLLFCRFFLDEILKRKIYVSNTELVCKICKILLFYRGPSSKLEQTGSHQNQTRRPGNVLNNKRNNEESFSFFLILHASEAKASENYIPLPFVKKKISKFLRHQSRSIFLRMDPGSRSIFSQG